MKMIDAKTKVCALIGDPVEHSFSPLIHNAGFQELNLNFVYVAFPVKDVERAIHGIRALHLRGASVTIPHKVKAISYVDKLDDVAQKIGSINTIVNQAGTLVGYNSDGTGALKAFQDHNVRLTGKTVLLLGSGGVARAIAFSLLMSTSLKKLSILGIIPEELGTLINDLKKTGGADLHGGILKQDTLQKAVSEAEILINCTPVGMSPNVEATPVPAAFLRPKLIVFDVVYNPPQTRLLREAGQAGCDTISGLEMFINQAVVQFELWTNEKAPVATMRKVVLEQITPKDKK